MEDLAALADRLARHDDPEAVGGVAARGVDAVARAHAGDDQRVDAVRGQHLVEVRALEGRRVALRMSCSVGRRSRRGSSSRSFSSPGPIEARSSRRAGTAGAAGSYAHVVNTVKIPAARAAARTWAVASTTESTALPISGRRGVGPGQGEVDDDQGRPPAEADRAAPAAPMVPLAERVEVRPQRAAQARRAGAGRRSRTERPILPRISHGDTSRGGIFAQARGGGKGGVAGRLPADDPRAASRAVPRGAARASPPRCRPR